MEVHGAFENGMPFVSVRVAGMEFRAVMDTGFDGFVMLSHAEIRKLNLLEMGKSVYQTADGELHEAKVYRGRIEWLGITTDVAVDSTNGDFALIGMKLLQSLRLVMEPSQRMLILSTAALH